MKYFLKKIWASKASTASQLLHYRTLARNWLTPKRSFYWHWLLLCTLKCVHTLGGGRGGRGGRSKNKEKSCREMWFDIYCFSFLVIYGIGTHWKKELANVHFLNYNFFSITYSRAEFSHRQFKQLLPEMSLQDSNYNEKFLYFQHSQKIEL